MEVLTTCLITRTNISLLREDEQNNLSSRGDQDDDHDNSERRERTWHDILEANKHFKCTTTQSNIGTDF